MATQITATLPSLDFPKEVDYPTQEDWAAFSAAAEQNFGILGGDWSAKMQLWKDQANAMSIELNTNSTIAQGLANYQGDWTSQGYTLGQTVSVSGVYYICKLTHATGQNPTTGGSIYWNLAIGNWNLKVNNYGDETVAGVKTFTSSPVVPTPTTNTQAANKQYADLKVALADFTGTNVSLTGNGYQKLPSGLIIQWGTDPESGSDRNINYPIAFPNNVFGVTLTPIATLTYSQSVSGVVGNATVSSFAAGLRYANDGGGVGFAAQGFYWFAIGY